MAAQAPVDTPVVVDHYVAKQVDSVGRMAPLAPSPTFPMWDLYMSAKPVRGGVLKMVLDADIRYFVVDARMATTRPRLGYWFSGESRVPAIRPVSAGGDRPVQLSAWLRAACGRSLDRLPSGCRVLRRTMAGSCEGRRMTVLRALVQCGRRLGARARVNGVPVLDTLQRVRLSCSRGRTTHRDRHRRRPDRWQTISDCEISRTGGPAALLAGSRSAQVPCARLSPPTRRRVTVRRTVGCGRLDRVDRRRRRHLACARMWLSAVMVRTGIGRPHVGNPDRTTLAWYAWSASHPSVRPRGRSHARGHCRRDSGGHGRVCLGVALGLVRRLRTGCVFSWPPWPGICAQTVIGCRCGYSPMA
jgi:hypothetical protein